MPLYDYPEINSQSVHPGWVSGKYYGTGLSWETGGIGNQIANALNWQYFSIPSPLTIDALGFRVTAITGTVKAILGIYEISGKYPKSKIIDSGEIIVASSGFKQGIIPSHTLPVGLYALAFMFNDSNSSLRIVGSVSSRVPGAFWINGADVISNPSDYNSQHYKVTTNFQLPNDISNFSWEMRLENPSILVRAA
jgi:hypothetical protein